jgi:predicted acyltransferase
MPESISASSSTPGSAPLRIAKDVAHSPRLMSLDALRGFDMFWIVGADEMVHGLQRVTPSPFINLLTQQMSHKSWEGVAFYDLIFPLFVFIVGVSLVFSLTRTMAQHGRAGAYRRVITRGVLLYLLGIFYYGGFSRGLDHIRTLGVLQRIALAYLFTGLLFCTFRLKGLVTACAALLLGYWALMATVPIRDINLEGEHLKQLSQQTGITNATTLYLSATNRVKGVFEEGRNLANHVDFEYLPGRKWDGAYDPEGLLSTMTAVGTCLLGVFAGMLLRNRTLDDRQKVRWLLGAGVAAVLLGFAWGHQFPVIKKIWTSSYVLVAGGYACIFLAVFHQIIEVWNIRKWAVPFVWIGVNPLTIYLVLHNIIPLDKIADRLVGGPIKASFGSYGEVVVALTGVVLTFAFARFLYTRKIFLRL